MVELVRYDAADIGTVYQGDDSSLAEKYGKLLAPFFRIEISDQSDEVLFSAEASVYEGNYDINGLIVSEVTWDENDCQASSMTIKVQNIDLQLQDNRMFSEGNSVDLWMGYDGLQPDYMGRGIIVERAPEFPKAGIPSISITLYDISYFMMEEGRAEIVPEGTAWFERRSQSNATSGNNSRPEIVGNEIANTERERRARVAREERIGTSGNTPTQTVQGNLPSVDLPATPASSRLVTPNRENSETEAGSGNTTRTSWQRARIPRRRRKSGKVWRELRDDEIVEKIFWSYGIVPYTEATNQRARGRLETQEEANQRTVVVSTHVSDTVRGRDNRRRRSEELGITPTAPTETVETNPELDYEITPAQFLAQTVQTEAEPAARQRTGGRRVVQKSGTSDLEFIKKLAKAHGHIVFVFFHHESRRWIGYWGPPQNVPQHNSYKFQYNAGDDTTLGKVNPKVSMRGQKTEIDLSFVDPRSGRTQTLRVAMDNVNSYSSDFRGPDGPADIPEALGNGPQVTLTIHGQRVQTIANRPFASMDDARRWLMAFWYQHATDFCQVEGDTIIGIPEMRARQKHEIEGIGRVSGNFFITKATHSMKPGSIYETKFSGYRVVDFLENPVTPESDLLTVDSADIGESTPEASNG